MYLLHAWVVSGLLSDSRDGGAPAADGNGSADQENVGPSEPEYDFAGDHDDSQDDVTTHPKHPLATLFKKMFKKQFGPEGGSCDLGDVGVMITVPKGTYGMKFIEVYKKDKLQVPLRSYLKWRDVSLLEGPTLSVNYTSLSVLSTS